jgi:hypothetical protein
MKLSTEDLEQLRQLLPLLIPIIVIQLGLIVAALIDLARRPATRGPKWLWLVIILFINLIGPIVYFLVGREEA